MGTEVWRRARDGDGHKMEGRGERRRAILTGNGSEGRGAVQQRMARNSSGTTHASNHSTRRVRAQINDLQVAGVAITGP